MTSAEIVVIAIYSIWSVASVISQSTTKYKVALKKKDYFQLLPNYKFFCPIPVKFDYHLYIRREEVNNTISEWEYLSCYNNKRIFHSIYNPEKRDRKAFFHFVKHVKKYSHNRKFLLSTAKYLTLLDFIKKRTFKAGAVAVQFKIIYKRDWDERIPEKLLYESDFHKYDLK